MQKTKHKKDNKNLKCCCETKNFDSLGDIMLQNLCMSPVLLHALGFPPQPPAVTLQRCWSSVAPGLHLSGSCRCQTLQRF